MLNVKAGDKYRNHSTLKGQYHSNHAAWLLQLYAVRTKTKKPGNLPTSKALWEIWEAMDRELQQTDLRMKDGLQPPHTVSSLIPSKQGLKGKEYKT
jgi:hypothetical protein